jgi:hypothetical protein
VAESLHKEVSHVVMETRHNARRLEKIRNRLRELRRMGVFEKQV